MHSKGDDFETLAADAADAADAAGGGPKKKGPGLKARAIAILSRRENSRLELQRKLAPHASGPDELEQLLNDLERENWLSNERFAQNLVHRRASRQGAKRIVQELRQHGLADEAIAGLNQQLRGTEVDRARAVWEKKFGHAPADAKEYAKQFRFLASRGFSADCLHRILGDLPEDAHGFG
ncbi:recombination regulator RecX [Pollutimonas bauzanensis]|uniref:Regulatory protein RecX n=1 Tax=Pollutimonas bauzanensis TaxID=658167 RepID=A0A1M5MGN8_9BURK|nr:recombination regulator RecX [Pollutimonas bauzanensis]SHG76367.1 regulatory protein [Pollutimonas bauzanensis]